ncbi:MAG: hypothetical protein H6736_15065 [Alphaproteobacteria bacterium]|nr:hypothetical protein [Alphaproteobacteria bacterium]
MVGLSTLAFIQWRPDLAVRGVLLTNVVLVVVSAPVFGGLSGPLPAAWGSTIVLAAMLRPRWVVLGVGLIAVLHLVVLTWMEVAGIDLTAVSRPEDRLVTLFTVLIAIALFGRGNFEHHRSLVAASLAKEAEARLALASRDAELKRRKDAESKLLVAARKARDAGRAKSEFLAGMSHELRTPLNAILGYTEILMEEMSNDGQQGDLHRIQSAGLHLLGLIDDVLDLSKIEAGRMDLELGSVDVGEVVRRVVGDHEQRARIAVHVEPGVSPVVADAARVGQIVRSLLGIALELPGSQQVVVRVGPGERPGVGLTVHAEGARMDASLRARLLRPFASPDPAQEAGSAGLGLVVSRHFAALMGGEVRIDEDGELALDLVEV